MQTRLIFMQMLYIQQCSRLVVIQKKATIFTFFILRTLRSVKNIAQFLAAVEDSVYQN